MGGRSHLEIRRRVAMQTRLYLTHAHHGRVLSWDEFIGAEFEEGYRYEMIEGRVYVSPAANSHHEDFTKWLEDQLWAYAGNRPDILQSVRRAARIFLPDQLEGV